MKVKIYVVLVLAVCLFASGIFAEAEETKSELVMVREFTVRPALRAQYAEAMKTIVAKCKEHNFPRSWYMWYDGDFHYYFMMPVKDYGDVDSYYEDFYAFVDKWGKEAYQEMADKAWAAVDSFYEYFIWTMPEYSYIPEEPRLKEEEIVFAIWDMYYLIPGKEKEFMDTVKDMFPLLKSKNVGDGVYWNSGAIGTKRPLYIAVLFGKDAADFWTQNNKIWEAIGEEGVKIYRKAMQFVKKNEFRQFYYVKSLSYVPEEK